MLDFARDKELWKRVRESEEFSQHRAELLELYEKAFKTEPRPHSAEDILENDDHGLWRLQFDQLQTSALLSLIYPENEEYYKNLLKIVWAYLNEYTWAPLGHYTEFYYQRTPKDFDYGLLDIFACSVAFSMAEVKNLFKDRFPQLLKDRISYELRRRTIEPFLNRAFFWEKHNNNWTAVCTGAVGSVLLYEAPELYYENKERIDSALKCYLDSYKDDGMCVEGVGYWEFGFGFFASFALLERELTEGRVDRFKDKKIKEISKFLQKTFLQDNVIVTFSDASVTQNYFFGIWHMLRHVYGDELEPLPKCHGHVVKDNTHFNFALRGFIYYDEKHLSDTLRTDVVYSGENSNYFIKRTKNYGFAVKGGDNGESHNHIDVGSFILARNNKQIICDVGGGPYEDGYHTDRRYSFFHPSAYAHNIPLFDGQGEDGIRREQVICQYDGKDRVYLDFTNGYGLEFLKKAERTFILKDDQITLIDHFDLSEQKEITEHFVSLVEPKIAGGVAVIDDVTLVAGGNIEPRLTVKEVKAHHGNRPHNVYILDYVLPLGQTDFELLIKM
ncbi:MAG: heparinase II/III family protein [Clostridia bacterium]|nr:heparinase II/III family protein [Clostridia bacterium]